MFEIAFDENLLVPLNKRLKRQQQNKKFKQKQQQLSSEMRRFVETYFSNRKTPFDIFIETKLF